MVFFQIDGFIDHNKQKPTILNGTYESGLLSSLLGQVEELVLRSVGYCREDTGSSPVLTT